jgi:hypothetical protein
MQAEVAMYFGAICRSLERIIEAAAALEAAELDWRPPAAEANSVFALATHAMANARENLLGTLCHQDVSRDRDAEFAASGGSAEALGTAWQQLRADLEAPLAALTGADLDRIYDHPRRGLLSGREVFLVVARHTAEHGGQAELTRDLALARR